VGERNDEEGRIWDLFSSVKIKKRKREREREKIHTHCVIAIICSLLHLNMGSIESLLYRIILVVTLLQITNIVHSQSVDKNLSKSILDFTVRFSSHHGKQNIVGSRSLVWSPLSLYQAMLMVGEGADGNTFKQFERITNLKTKEDYHQWSLGFLNDAKDNLEKNHRYNISLNVANRLYADKNFDLNKQFNEKLKKYYHSELELIDFNERKKSANQINQWISNQTNNIIKNVLKPNDINRSTCLMLVNALHFKAPWSEPFHPKLTTNENFTLSNGKIIELQTMHLTSHFSYYYDKDHKSQWINLPYKGNNRYVLTLALPDKDNKLFQLEGYLRNSEVLSNIFHSLDNPKTGSTHVELSLPKFRIESSLDFVQYFKKYYNVTLPFNAKKADFSLMSSKGERDLFISKIIHKAVIDVDEAGTEAAAVTVIRMQTYSASYETPLSFSRPFLFYLRDINLKIPLFVGRFTGMPMT
jgi:serpin B